MTNGGVSKLACRERLRSHDIKGKNKEWETGKRHYYEEEEKEEEEDEDDEEDEEEEEKMRDGVKKVKSRKASTAVLEKKKRRKVTTNLSDDDEKEDVAKLDKKAKNKDEKRMHGGDDKMKYRKVPTTTFDKENKKKFVSSHGCEKKMQNGDHEKDKRRNAPFPLDKNKDSLKEKSRKMPSSHSGEKKMPSGDHHKEKKKKSMHSNSKPFEKEKRKTQSSDNSEKRIRSYDYGEHRGQRAPHLFNKNVMQKNEMKKKKKKMCPNDHMEKKMRTNDKDEKAGSGDRWKTKNKTMEGYNKEQKVQNSHKEERNVSIAFFKLIYNDFEKFLLLPPVVAPKLSDLTNCRVNLQDSEGKFSEVRLSMVDGSLAFHQGWNDFVSDHSIKLGDFLLFEYTARSQFSVRVFGMDSCERVCFGVERQGGKKRKGCHAPDETENVAKSMNAVSVVRCVAVNSKEDPNRVVSGVEHGSSVALYDKDGYLANGKHKANGAFQTWSKGTRSSEIILITDDEAPLTQENEDAEKLKTLHVASETHCVSASTKEDPKGIASGALCGPSVAIDKKLGTMAIGERKTNCISSICSTGKTIRSEIIPVIDAAPVAQENDDALKLTTFPLHIEDTSMMKESEPEIATPAKCTEIQDSDEDLRWKQEGNAVQLECTIAVDKCPINSTMNTNGDVCSKHEATGCSPSLEKWKKATVSGQAALDGTGLIKPEKLLETVGKLVGNCSSLGVNSLEQLFQGYAGRAALDSTGLIRPEKRLKTDEDLIRKQEGNTVQLKCTTAVDKCPNNSKTSTNGSVCSKHEAPGGSPSLEKWKKATVSGRAALDGTGLIKPEKILKTEDKLVGNCSSMGVNSFERSLNAYAGRAALDGTGLIRPENRLKSEDKLVGKCSAMGVNPVEQSLRGYAGTHPCVQQTPGKISNSGHIKTETDHFVKGKGPIVQPKTQMEQFEPMGSIACRQQMNNIPGRVDHAVARLSEHQRGSPRKQEGNTVQLNCTTAMDKCPNNSKMSTNGSVCSKHEAPGGSPSLEKWKKATVSGRAALDGTGLIKPEKLLKTEDKLVGNCSSMGVNSFERSLNAYAGRAALDGTGLIRPENQLKSEDKLVGKCSAMGVNPVEQSLRGYAGTHSCVQQTPGKISNSGHIKTETDHFVKGKGPIIQPKTHMEQFEPMGSIACRQQMNNIPGRVDHAVARLSEHHFFRQEDRKSSHHVAPTALLPVNVEVLDDHSVLKTNLQFCIPPTTQTWLELPTSLSNALRRKGRQDRNVVMLKDPMKRLWPVFYHENSLFVGFTRGWKPFVAANNLQTGDVCMLLKDLDEDELVYHVQITKK